MIARAARLSLFALFAIGALPQPVAAQPELEPAVLVGPLLLQGEGQPAVDPRVADKLLGMLREALQQSELRILDADGARLTALREGRSPPRPGDYDPAEAIAALREATAKLDPLEPEPSLLELERIRQELLHNRLALSDWAPLLDANAETMKAAFYAGDEKRLMTVWRDLVRLRPDFQLPPGTFPRQTLEQLEAERKAAAGRARGKLTISTAPPLMKVTIEGRPAGESPVTVELPAGEVAVAVQGPGLLPARRKVEVAADESRELRLNLEPDAALGSFEALKGSAGAAPGMTAAPAAALGAALNARSVLLFGVGSLAGSNRQGGYYAALGVVSTDSGERAMLVGVPVDDSLNDAQARCRGLASRAQSWLRGAGGAPVALDAELDGLTPAPQPEAAFFGWPPPAPKPAPDPTPLPQASAPPPALRPPTPTPVPAEPEPLWYQRTSTWLIGGGAAAAVIVGVVLGVVLGSETDTVREPDRVDVGIPIPGAGP